MEIHTLELNKPMFLEKGKKAEQLFYWMRLFKAEREEEIKMLATKIPEIEEAYEVMKRLSSDEEVRLLYDSREKAIRDEHARLYGAREEGRAEGIEIGERNKAIKVARDLFKMGWSVIQVTQLTDLTVSEAEDVRRQMAVDELT